MFGSGDELHRVNIWLRLLCVVIIWLCAENTHAQTIIEINSGVLDFSIQKGDSLLVTYDATGTLTYPQIIDTDLFEEPMKSGSSDGLYWSKVRLLNKIDYDLELITKFSAPNATIFKMNNGEVIQIPFGSFQELSGRNYGDGRKYVSIKLKSGVVETLYFKSSRRPGEIYFTDSTTFRLISQSEGYRDFFLYGASFILVLFALIQFAVYRYTPFLWLTVFALGTAMYAFAIRGYQIDWFFPENPKFGHNFSMPWVELGHLGLLMIAITFLDLKNRFTGWYRVFIGMVIITILRTGYGMYATLVHDDYELMTIMLLSLFMVDMVIFNIALIRLWKKVDSSEKVFLTGLVLFGVAIIIAFITWTQMPSITTIRVIMLYTSSLASLSQVLVFSVALGLKMRQHEVDKNAALDHLNAVLKEQKDTIQQEVIEQTQMLRDQKNQIEEKKERIETLFKEVHHRVKNNLQLVSSLLNTQREWSSVQDPAEAIEDSRSRVVAMSMIHQFLYQTDDISTINFESYVKELVNKLDGIQVKKTSYKLKLDFGNDCYFDVDTSISLGLIFNELITNAYKHAVQRRHTLLLDVKIKMHQQGFYTLTFKDNGLEMEQKFEEAVKSGFGLRLASRLSRQLQGKMSHHYDEGNVFEVEFTDAEARLSLIE